MWCPKRVIWHASCAQFSTLGTIERCTGTWEHTEADLGGPGLDFYRFWKDFGAAISMFLANFGTTIVSEDAGQDRGDALQPGGPSTEGPAD